MRNVIVTFLCFLTLVSPAFAQQAAPQDYKKLYEESKEELRLLKERLDRALMENKALKSELATLKKRPAKAGEVASAPVAAEAPAAPARAPIPTAIEAKLKLNEVINLQSIGGPNVRMEVKSFRYGVAVVRIGSDQTDRKIEIRGDRTLLFRDVEYDVYLVNRLVMSGEVTLQFVEKE